MYINHLVFQIKIFHLPFQKLYEVSNYIHIIYVLQESYYLDDHRGFGGGLSNKTVETEAPCHTRCSTIKYPFGLNAIGGEHRSKYCSHSLLASPFSTERN